MAFDFQVSLQVRHPDADPTEIAVRLGLPANRSWKAGERRATPAGTQLPGIYNETYCSFRFGRGDDGALAKCLREAVNFLEPKRPYLSHLRNTGGSINFYVGWVVGTRGEVFDTCLLSDIAQLGIDLGIEPFRIRQA